MAERFPAIPLLNNEIIPARVGADHQPLVTKSIAVQSGLSSLAESQGVGCQILASRVTPNLLPPVAGDVAGWACETCAVESFRPTGKTHLLE